MFFCHHSIIGIDPIDVFFLPMVPNYGFTIELMVGKWESKTFKIYFKTNLQVHRIVHKYRTANSTIMDAICRCSIASKSKNKKVFIGVEV
jgi:hypothetical protein